MDSLWPSALKALRIFYCAVLGAVLCSGCATKKFTITEVSPGIFIGAEPRTAANFKILHERGVRTVLNLECLPWKVVPDRTLARRNGMDFRHFSIPATPIQPEEKNIKEAILLMRDQSL